MTYLFGIDGGGTSCRAVVADQRGKQLGWGRGSSANIFTDMRGAIDNIVHACELAVDDAGLGTEVIGEGCAVLGLAGANIGRRAEILPSALPFQLAKVETDARIVVEGALGQNDGAAAIIGTGSIFISSYRGKIRSIGGWGFTVGDLCSGARLGRTLLQEVLQAHDNVHEGSDLTRAVMASFGDSPQTLVEYAHTVMPRDFGAFAPLIFEYAEEGDLIAKKIIDDALVELKRNILTLIETNDLPFCMLGGLASSYSRWLDTDLHSLKIQPKGNGLDGAISMAVDIYGDIKTLKRKTG